MRKLQRWPGARLRAASVGKNRGNCVLMGNKVYTVNGSSLVSLDSGFNHSTIGEIDGGGVCHLVTDGTNLIVSTGQKRYQYNGTLTEITDGDHQAGNTATFINSRIAMDGNGGAFQVADIGDPDSINSLNFATAESAPDDTIAVKAFKQRLLVFGTDTVEPWFNDGSSDFPPYSRIEGGIQQFGLGSVHSLANDESYVYLLSSNNHIYRLVDIEAQRITPVPMERFLEDNVTSDARGWCMSFAGQWFYVLTFPTAGKTWVIPLIDPASAFQISSDLVRGPHMASAYIHAFGRHLIIDRVTGGFYEWVVGEFQDAGNNVLVERAIAPLNGEAFGLTADELTMNQFSLVMETGVGNSAVPDPVGIFDLSVDGGNSFVNETWVKLGQDGLKKTVRYNKKKKFKDASVRFRVVDPIDVSLHSAAIKIKAGGGK